MHPLLVGILAANCGIMGFDIYLRVRQWKVVNRTTELPPELNEGASVARVFDQIRISTLRRTEMAILYCFYKLIQVTTLLCYYCPSFLWTWTIHHFGNRMWQPVAYVIEESIISDLIRLPLNLIVFLELRRTQQNHKVALLLSSHEGNMRINVYKLITCFLNMKTVYNFIAIFIGKMMLKGAVVGMATYYTSLVLQTFGGNVFLWSWMISLLTTIILVPLYIEIIIPLLDEYTQLTSGSLKQKLERLANEVNFPLSSIYISLGNHADADHVAYFTGMFSSKVIVISLTLILSMTEEEIVAIVAHEMGHWKLRHAWYYLISRAFYNLFLCVLLMNYYDSLKLYNAFNIEVNNTPPHPVLSFILIADYMLPPFDRQLHYPSLRV
ncbi:uncharacterized protein isoform X3 [Rhodnius prolixus]|uniref:uncharacterized protein isoform X3 n=1 Tax=Rhodnius prolixus TaxID=13249 RepID=UPI003D188D7C